MSESAFLQTEVERFRAAHPKGAGWLVYEFSERLQDEVDLGSVIDFLRDRYPEAVRRRHVGMEVRTQELLGQPGDSHQVSKNGDWDKKELDIHDWSGELELEWQGVRIHYLRFHLGGAFSSSVKTFVASKSNFALRDFHEFVRRYAADREKTNERRIHVIGGTPIVVPRVGWGDIILSGTLAVEIRENILGFFRPATKELYRKLGVPYRRGFILTGPAGCGKTLTLKAIASEIRAAFVALPIRANVKDHELGDAFRFAEKHAPAVLILEDLDRLVASPGISLSYVLNKLDGLQVAEGVLVIATSNYPQKLDPALLHRPSRFDRIWNFPLPGIQERRALLDRLASQYFSEGALDKVARASAGFSMAYVQEIVVNALLSCAQGGGALTDDHLTKSLEVLRKQRKATAKEQESVVDRQNIGFSSQRANRFDDFDESDYGQQ